MNDESIVRELRAHLDAADRTPLKQQLTVWFRERIATGKLSPGAVLPKEIELAAALGVSRQTVNHAYALLADDRYVTRKRGVGTFVATPVVEQPLNAFYSFIDSLTAQGRKPGSILLDRREIRHDHAALLTPHSPDGRIHEVTRLRLVDDEPFVIETIHLDPTVGSSLSANDLERAGLYDILEARLGFRVSHSEETLRPIVLSRLQAALLEVGPEIPAFLVDRTTYADDRLLEIRASVIPGDRYRFSVRLDRNRLDPSV